MRIAFVMHGSRGDVQPAGRARSRTPPTRTQRRIGCSRRPGRRGITFWTADAKPVSVNVGIARELAREARPQVVEPV